MNLYVWVVIMARRMESGGMIWIKYHSWRVAERVRRVRGRKIQIRRNL